MSEPSPREPAGDLGFDPGFEPAAPRPGIGGRLRDRHEDFLVEEIPLYEPSGSGEHAYLFVEKRGLSTLDAVAEIARHFGVPRRDVGYAGLKDKHAITRQTISVRLPGRALSDVPSLEHERLSILWADRHGNKLRPGHLEGNRFSIRVRGVGFEAAVAAQRTLHELERAGLANRYDRQRFGVLGNNHEIGRELVLGRWSAAAERMLGPSERSPRSQAEARRLFVEGRPADALEAFPRSLRAERTLLRAIASGALPEEAFRELDRRTVAFYVSAFQSAVFNAVLDRREREGTSGRLLEGDQAFVRANGKTFLVDAAEMSGGDVAAREAAGELIPSGPVWGSAMRRAQGVPGEFELEALMASGVEPSRIDEFARETRMMEGARRPLRVPVSSCDVESGVDAHGAYVRCAFELPRGAFATSVMREIMGRDATESEE